MKILGSLGLILLIFFIFCLILGIAIAFYKAKTEQANNILCPLIFLAEKNIISNKLCETKERKILA